MNTSQIDELLSEIDSKVHRAAEAQRAALRDGDELGAAKARAEMNAYALSWCAISRARARM